VVHSRRHHHDRIADLQLGVADLASGIGIAAAPRRRTPSCSTPLASLAALHADVRHHVEYPLESASRHIRHGDSSAVNPLLRGVGPRDPLQLGGPAAR